MKKPICNLISVITSLCIVSVSSQVVSQTQPRFISIGRFGTNHCEEKLPKQISSSESNFKTGQNWAVLSLGRSSYHGTARVVAHGKNICEGYIDTSSHLLPNLSHPPENEDLLLIRPVPRNLSIIRSKQISCSKLPSALLSQIHRYKSSVKLAPNSCYVVYTNADNTPDIARLKVIETLHEHDLVFAISNSSWLLKYKYSVYTGPE